MNTVLHLSSSSGPGGAERIVCALAASLDPARFRSLVGLFRPGWLKEQCEQHGLQTHVFPDEGVAQWQWIRECYRVVKREKVDLIQAHEFDANVHGMVVARMARIPMVATVHGKHYFWEKARRRVAYRLLSRYAKIVAVSEDLKKFVAEEVGVPEHRIQVVYNGVSEPAPVGLEQVRLYKRDLGIPESDLVVGVVGNLYPVKGHKYLLEALPDVLGVCPQTTVLLIGRGELELSLKAQAKELGIENKVRFLGLRQDVPKLLAVMDVFAMPSLSEGLSIALLEAMAAGKPVVVTKVGGNPELVGHGTTGLLVPERDPVAFGGALASLLSDPEKRKTLGAACRERVRSQFTLQVMTSHYQRIYQQALSRRP